MAKRARRAQRSQPKPRPKPTARSPANGGAPVAEQIATAVARLSEERQTTPVAKAPAGLTEARLRGAWEDLQRLHADAADAQRRAQQVIEREAAVAAAEQAQAQAERASELAGRDAAVAAAERELESGRAELESGREELRSAHAELESGQRSLQAGREELAAARELLDEDRARLADRVEERVRHRIAERDERQRLELEEARMRLEQAERHNEQLLARAVAAEAGARLIEGRPAAEVEAELEGLRAEQARLRDELATRPRAEESMRAEELARRNRTLLEELQGALQSQGRLEDELVLLRRAALEQQRAETHAGALRATIEGYRATIEEQKRDFDALMRHEEARSPFEQMTAMDGDDRLRDEVTGRQPESLGRLVRDLRALIAARTARSGSPLHYSERDLRLFVAGLASNRLAILQGLSGTGKTSLPLAVADAIDGGHAVVEVQAGWRDRQDLLGHYNTFERRYDETTFVQALYRAQTPAFAERPFFIVLDEMNLSHPEQYFADLLSALTRERERPEIALTNTQLTPAPTELRDGRFLPIPPNVWFVGTANHDETTKAFADKTYDRAHVLELGRPDDEGIGAPPGREIVAFRGLQRLFDRAEREHADLAGRARELLRSLAPAFEQVEVAWGNRLDPQVRRFVPAVKAAGGGDGEAIDHVIATKVLRKVRGRHDVERRELTELERAIRDAWAEQELPGEASVSLRLLEREKRRKERGLG